MNATRNIIIFYKETFPHTAAELSQQQQQYYPSLPNRYIVYLKDIVEIQKIIYIRMYIFLHDCSN